MKILIASDSYIYQTSGIMSVLVTLVRGLRQLGHEVKVLAPANDGHSFRKGEDYFLRSVPALVYPDLRFCLVRRDPLLEELTRWKPDLIHLHTEGPIAQLAFKMASTVKAPVVITLHTDYGTYIFGRFHDFFPIRALGNLWGKAFYRHADAIVAPSEKVKSFPMVHAYLDRITVISNGICLERYQRPVSIQEKAALLREYGLKDNGFILVMISRVSKEKNIMEILRYFPALLQAVPEAQLFIVGDGPDRKRLEKFCERRGLSECIRFIGRVEPDHVYRYYALGNVFVSASTFEVHSMTYLEAMACGLPLVCRNDPCLKNVLEDSENGFIYNTEREFVNAVSTILRDKQLWEAMHNNALEKVKDYIDMRFVEHTMALYEKMLGLPSRESTQSKEKLSGK